MSKPIEIDLRMQRSGPKQGSESFVLQVKTKLPGEGVSCIIGASGCGKTTLLRCIAGLERAPDARISVAGDIWQDHRHFMPTHQRRVGYVFQEASLFEHLDVLGNLQFAWRRVKPKPEQSLFDQVLKQMDLAPLLARRPHQLSGGERQRVALARAVLQRPRLLLMDEPLAALDSARKQEILPYLEVLRRESKTPIIYVSHAMQEVARLADHVLVLENGRNLRQGPLTEVFAAGDLPFLPELETGVILSGRITRQDPQWHLCEIQCQGFSLWLRDDGLQTGTQVRIQVLARDISITHSVQDASSIVNRISARIEVIREDRDPAMSLLHLRVGQDVMLARLTRRSVAELSLQVGQNVWAQLKSAALVR